MLHKNIVQKKRGATYANAYRYRQIINRLIEKKERFFDAFFLTGDT